MTEWLVPDSIKNAIEVALELFPFLKGMLIFIGILLALVLVSQIVIWRRLPKNGGNSLSVILLAGMMFGGVAATQNAKAWGAVATYPSNSIHHEGIVPVLTFSHSTEEEARRRVLLDCETVASDGCTVVETFQNMCAATSAGDVEPPNAFPIRFYYGIGPDQDTARAAAFSACQEGGDQNCGVGEPVRCDMPLGSGGGTGGGTTGGTPTPTTSGGGGGGSSAGLIVGGIAAVGLAAWALSGDDAEAFSFSPDFGYSITESGYAVNAGGRMDFRQDEWHLYWTANVGDKGLGYASGGEWQKDIWRAAFSERVAGEVADYNFSLSAKYDGGVWEVAPAYRLHSRLQNGESETDNSLNLEGVLLWNRWAIKPSAGFQWRNAKDFGDNAKFGFSAVRNL